MNVLRRPCTFGAYLDSTNYNSQSIDFSEIGVSVRTVRTSGASQVRMSGQSG